MRRHILALALFASMGVPQVARSGTTQAEAKEPFKLIGQEELAAQLAQKGTPVHLFDANDPEYRAKNGIIPGAKLLSSSSRFDVAKELPADKTAKLVFYCANSH